MVSGLDEHISQLVCIAGADLITSNMPQEAVLDGFPCRALDLLLDMESVAGTHCVPQFLIVFQVALKKKKSSRLPHVLFLIVQASGLTPIWEKPVKQLIELDTESIKILLRFGLGLMLHVGVGQVAC